MADQFLAVGEGGGQVDITKAGGLGGDPVRRRDARIRHQGESSASSGKKPASTEPGAAIPITTIIADQHAQDGARQLAMDAGSPVGAFLSFASRAAELLSETSGAPDPQADPDLREQCPEVWWAFHDRRSVGDDTVHGLGAEIKVSWNGIAYEVSLIVRQMGMQTRFSMPLLGDLAAMMEAVMRRSVKTGWQRWEPYKGTQAARQLAESKQKRKQQKRD